MDNHGCGSMRDILAAEPSEHVQQCANIYSWSANNRHFPKTAPSWRGALPVLYLHLKGMALREGLPYGVTLTVSFHLGGCPQQLNSIRMASINQPDLETDTLSSLC